MKKWLPYLIGALALALLILLALLTPFRRDRTLDERISLRQRDKIPYGTYVAHHLLSETFSNAHVSFDKAAPGFWSGINEDTSNQAVFLISRNFDPDDEEMKRLMQFVRHGNQLFLITQNFGWDAAHYLNLKNEKQFLSAGEDSLQVALHRSLARASAYLYPGKKFDSYFSQLDPATARPLGTDADGHTNFIQLQAGAGNLFIHLAPLAFSNYFLLHKTNIRYFESILSLIPSGVDKIVWNEYYLSRREKKEEEPNILRVLWQHEPFRWALITAIATLLLYVLSAMRRRQRLIPPYANPANDSLDFVRTMGRLYYDRRDHHNLAKKMAAFFVEGVRSRYKIGYGAADETFVEELHAKSGYAHEDLKKIADFIQYINTYDFITEQELARFYRQLSLFYKHTDGTFV